MERDVGVGLGIWYTFRKLEWEFADEETKRVNPMHEVHIEYCLGSTPFIDARSCDEIKHRRRIYEYMILCH